MASILEKIFKGDESWRERYKILEEIATGGMSVVYKAVDTSDDSIVAVKVLKPESVEVAKKFRKLFQSKSEGAIAMSFRHPNVIRTYSYGNEGDEYYIVMEYVDGPNLSRIITENDPKLTGNRKNIIYQMGAGLAHIHEKGLVHRDFCPKNVLLDKFINAKIIDFGLSIPERERSKDIFDRSGTASYMAPEQIRGQLVDVRTDIYAFGISMYEILTGRNPFPPSGDRFARMQSHLNVDPKPPSQIDPNIPKQIDHIILKAMSKEKSHRYQDMRELIRDLDVVAWSDKEHSQVIAKLVTSAPYLQPEYILEKDRTSIGRSDDNEITIPDSTKWDDWSTKRQRRFKHDIKKTSRRHALIVKNNTSFFIQDLKSSNGTFVNGKRVRPGLKRELKNGDVIVFGKTEFVFSSTS